MAQDDEPPPSGDSAWRTVLEAWDFRDRDALHALARQHGANAEVLDLFARSETCRDLAAARCRQWNMEFALNLGADLPVVQGVMDCVWEDGDGRWHVLYFAPEAVAKGKGESYWKLRQREIVLAATAMQRQTGSYPKTVQIHVLADGDVIRRRGDRLPCKRVLEEVMTAMQNPAESVVPS